MADDTLREVAQEAVARVEGAPVPTSRTGHGEQVATALRAEADKDVFTTLQIAAGEQVSPAIIRANIDVSIGILGSDGKIDRTPAGSLYEKRYNRAEAAVKRAEKYFDDQKNFTEFSATTEGKKVIASTGKFLMTHPALSEYFAIVPAAGRVDAAKALAEKYLQDPYAREKIRQSLLESQLNKGDVADEYSETEAKRAEMDAKSKSLEATIKQLEAEAKLLKARRGEYDRTPDLRNPTRIGTEFTAIAGLQATIATQEGIVAAKTSQIRTTQAAVATLRSQYTATDKSDTTARATIQGEIATKNGEITAAQGDLDAAAQAIATEQKKIDAHIADKKVYDDKIEALAQKIKTAKEDKQKMSDELRELTMKRARLEAGKGRAEELAVAELENIFKKGVEEELMERLNKAKEVADKALEESAEKAKDIDEKQYRELRAKRHKTDDGKIDGPAIKEDFTGMMRTSTEYYITADPANPNKVIVSAKNPDGTWAAITPGATVPTTPAGSSTFYLTGPEFAMIQMMNNTSEFGNGFILGKLKDSEWMQAESQDFATQVLREKMYASRGMLQRKRTGVKRLGSSEIAKIKNSTWGVGLLEKALEQNREHVKEMDAVMKSDILQGPGSWKEKIGRMSNKQIALLILGLTAGGALLGPIAWPAILSTGGKMAGVHLTSAHGGAAIAGGAAAAAAASGRSRTS